MKKALLIAASMATAGLYAQDNALNFDGSNDYVSSPYSGITGNSARTVEAMIRTTTVSDPNQGGTQMVIYDMGTMGTGTRFTFNVLWNNTIRLEVGGSGMNGTTSVNDGSWHHVAVVYSPGGSNPIKLYVDGTLDAQGTISTTVATSASSTSYVGMRCDAVHGFDGDIDELRVWNRALTATEIAANSSTFLCGGESGLDLYYQFNAGNAGGNNANVTMATDAAGSNDGTLTGFALSGSSSNWISTGRNLVGGPTSSSQALSGCSSVTLPSNGHVVSASGTYRDTVANSVGCDSIITYTVTLAQVNTIVTQSGNALSATLGLDGYQWIDCATGDSIPGASSYRYVPTQNGSYAALITQNGCTDTSDCFEITGIGLTENATSELVAYPNPSVDGNIYFELIPSASTSTIRVYDLRGALIKDVQVAPNTTNVSIQLPSGTYTLQHTAGDRVSTSTVSVL